MRAVGRPVQVIVPDVEPHWRSIDLSLLDEAARAQRLDDLLMQDRAERFDLAAPPLLRFALIRLAAGEHRLVLTSHHILLDGWSLPVLVRELLTLYAHNRQAHVQDGAQHRVQDGDAAAALPRVTPYGDYLAWIARQDHAAATAAWREALAGLEEPTYLAPRTRARAPAVPGQISLTLSEELTTALTRQARAQGLTLSTFIQAAWGILLGRLTGRDDVVFGVTVAGRPAEIAGIETMVGLFINTLPLRLKLPPAKPFVDLLKELQDSQSRLIAHQQLGLAEIQGLAGLGELFDTLTVFENYPVDDGGPGGRGRRPASRRHRRTRRHALSAEPAGGAGRAAAAAARLPRRPVRCGQRPGDRRAPRPAAHRRGQRPRPRHRQPRHSLPRRAPHHPDRLERHRPPGPDRHHPGAVRPAGRPHPGRGRAGLRG